MDKDTDITLCVRYGLFCFVCVCMYGILELAMRVELKICNVWKKKALGNWNSNLGVGYPRGSPPYISGVNKHNSSHYKQSDKHHDHSTSGSQSGTIIL